MQPRSRGRKRPGGPRPAPEDQLLLAPLWRQAAGDVLLNIAIRIQCAKLVMPKSGPGPISAHIAYDAYFNLKLKQRTNPPRKAVLRLSYSLVFKPK